MRLDGIRLFIFPHYCPFLKVSLGSAWAHLALSLGQGSCFYKTDFQHETHICCRPSRSRWIRPSGKRIYVDLFGVVFWFPLGVIE